jgi:ribosomal protein S3, bacterial type
MGQKVNPISNRIGIIRGWDSNWYGGKDYSSKILEDTKIRQYLEARLASASLSKIVIERTLKLITVTIHTARPGIIIGKGGSEVEKLKEELKNITKKDIQINIYEVKRPEADANIVAQSIARQVEGRVSYRRAIKMAVSTTMRVGAEGIKVLISGRLGGAEMARTEMFKEGRTPLHTFRADIDYALAEAHTKVGVLGIKVWICNGEVYGKRDLSPNAGIAANSQAAQAAASRGEGGRGDRRGPRGPRRDGDRRGGRSFGDRNNGGDRPSYGDRGPRRDGDRSPRAPRGNNSPKA